MKKIILILNLVSLGFLSCERVPTAPLAEKRLALAQVNSIVWTLSDCAMTGAKKNLSTYEPVHLVFSDSLFWGDDGCNLYGSRYQSKNDSILPNLFSMTEKACGSVIFPVQFLSKPFVLTVYDTRIIIQNQNSRYTFSSDFTDPIDAIPQYEKPWRLIGATDPMVADIQAKGLVSALVLGKNRTFDFALNWQEDNARVNYQTNGVFGVGDRGVWLFYQQGGSSAGIGPSILAQKILLSNRYQLNQNRLTLINDSDAVQYVFSAE